MLLLPGNIKELLLSAAVDLLAKKAPVHEGHVLKKVGIYLANRLENIPLGDQRRMIEAWQELFEERTLAPGFDINTPGRPYFHKPKE